MLFQDNPLGTLFMLVAGVHIKSKRLMETRLRSFNLTYPQFGVLLALSQKDRIPQKELADVLDTDSTTVMVICDGLQKKGFVARVSHPRDRRSKLLLITAAGRKRFGKAVPIMNAYMSRLAGTVSTAQIQAATAVLSTLYRAVEHEQ